MMLQDSTASRSMKVSTRSASHKGILLGTPNREPQEYSRYIIGIYLITRVLIFHHIPAIFLGFPIWGSQ